MSTANYYNTLWDWSSGTPERVEFIYEQKQKLLWRSGLPPMLLPTAQVIFDGIRDYKLCWFSANYIGVRVNKSRNCIVNHIEQLRASGIFIIESKTAEELEDMKARLRDWCEPGELLYINHPKESKPDAKSKSKYKHVGFYNVYNINHQSPLWNEYGVDDTILEHIRQISDVQRMGRRSVYYSDIRINSLSTVNI